MGHKGVGTALHCLGLESYLFGDWMGDSKVTEHQITQRRTEDYVAWFDVPMDYPQEVHYFHAVLQPHLDGVFVT